MWPLEAQTPYRQLSGNTDFPGKAIEAGDSDIPLAAIRIGVTAPARTKQGRQLVEGARLAVAEANAGGGYGGIPYEVVFRPDDGAWGVAAQQVVRLAYDDRVWAVIGGADGRGAHAAALVAARAWIPVVVPAVAERSIDYANVPWVFRCLPDDRRQAQALLRCIDEVGWRRVAVVSEGTRAGRAGAAQLRQAARGLRHPLAYHFEYSPLDPAGIVPRIVRAEPEALLVWGGAAGAALLVAELRRRGVEAPVLSPSFMALPSVVEQVDQLGEMIVAAPFDLSASDPARRKFRRAFAAQTGEEPSYFAAMAYDATHMVIGAIERSGLSRLRLRDELARVPFAGVTGTIAFDDLGGSRSDAVLMRLTEGGWVRW